MTKEILEQMNADERSAFLLLGYASNQVNLYWKLVIIATNNTPDDPVEQRVSGAQTQILVRATIGAMWEAWRLVETRFLSSKLGKDYVPLLDTPSRQALDRLKKTFASGVLSKIRNSYAYHHPTNEQMEAAFQSAVANNDGEDIDWSIFFNRALLNTCFFVSDFVLVHGIANEMKEANLNDAHRKLLGDLAHTANDLSEFTFGFAKAIFQKYISKTELVMTVVAKISDAPNIDDARIPHYVETPNLRNE
jgi:hypothetical protein